MEKRSSQLEHRQPMEQTRALLFCTCDSCVAHCQLQQYHFWQMRSMFEAYCMGKWAWQLSIKCVEFMRLWTGGKILRFIIGLLRKCKYNCIKSFCHLKVWENASKSSFFCYYEYNGAQKNLKVLKTPVSEQRLTSQ